MRDERDADEKERNVRGGRENISKDRTQKEKEEKEINKSMRNEYVTGRFGKKSIDEE